MSEEYSGCPSDRQQLGDVPLPFVSEKKRCLNRVESHGLRSVLGMLTML